MLQSVRNILAFRFAPAEITNVVSKMSEVKIIRKTRYDGRSKKRQWEERRSDKGEGLELPKTAKIPKTESPITSELIDKIRRRKFALLVGYSGTNYYGMQRNPLTKTIEEEIFKSLLENKYITEENFAQVQTMQYQRAARTDKGVSAARQVISMKLPENIEVAKINEKLPEDIRVYAVKRVTKGFNSKTLCDGRTYFYMMPTVAFVPVDTMMAMRGFRLDSATYEKVNRLLQQFIGTKNFHNFTAKKKFNDPSAKRFIRSFFCDTPFVRQDVEFAVIKVQGQSFMLHQIRKMIGLIISIMKGHSREEVLSLAFENEKVNVPRAPGLGLVLDYVHYERYNQRYGADGMHDKMLWDEVEDDIKEFTEKNIYPIITETEIRDEAMINWVTKKLLGHHYDVTNAEDDNSEEEQEDDEDKDLAEPPVVEQKGTGTVEVVEEKETIEVAENSTIKTLNS